MTKAGIIIRVAIRNIHIMVVRVLRKATTPNPRELNGSSYLSKNKSFAYILVCLFGLTDTILTLCRWFIIQNRNLHHSLDNIFLTFNSYEAFWRSRKVFFLLSFLIIFCFSILSFNLLQQQHLIQYPKTGRTSSMGVFCRGCIKSILSSASSIYI